MIPKKLWDGKVNLRPLIMKSILKKSDNQGDGNRYFSDKVVEWYQRHHRKLPWRETRDPYRIWLSEVILQQTRVAQGLPYYERFVERFPTVQDLAASDEEAILRLWQGLGYYTRARNLMRCAQTVVAEHGGTFPPSYQELRRLPGIGDYTAAAIASIAFEEPVAVLDGNVFRVLARYFGVYDDMARADGRKHFTSLANSLVEGTRPSIYNQAVMELGALCCIPQIPHCGECVLAEGCFAHQKGLQAELPVRKPRLLSKNRYFYYFVIVHRNRVAMRKRSGKDIWQNLYDFYLAESSREEPVSRIIKRDEKLRELIGNEALIEVSPAYQHILTHQKILARFVTVRPDGVSSQILDGMRFFTKKGIEKLPKPVLITRFLAQGKIL